jgi:hypothetical protein
MRRGGVVISGNCEADPRVENNLKSSTKMMTQIHKYIES